MAHKNDHHSPLKQWSRLALSLTWSAMVRPSLSILDPASAIFLAALITSDVFLSGPLPLEKDSKDPGP